MLSNFKATLLRPTDLSLAETYQLISWPLHGELNFAPGVKIARATNPIGEVICYCVVEPALSEGAVLIRAHVMSPAASKRDAILAGDIVTHEIKRFWQHHITRLLIFNPKDGGFVEDKITRQVEPFGCFTRRTVTSLPCLEFDSADSDKTTRFN